MRLFRSVLTLGVLALSALAEEDHQKHAYQVGISIHHPAGEAY